MNFLSITLIRLNAFGCRFANISYIKVWELVFNCAIAFSGKTINGTQHIYEMRSLVLSSVNLIGAALT